MPLLAVVLALAIFAVDTFSPFDMAIAVLYVVVVLVAAVGASARGILIAGAACIFLTLLSFAIIHAEDYDIASTMRCIVSIAAVAVTTLLTLRNLRRLRSLRDQAALLDLTHDAILVRDDADTITYWSHGAEVLYGWTRAEAMGRRVSDLLQTVFPAPVGEVRRQLYRTGRWEGELVHTRRDGRTLAIMSRWSLQRDDNGRPAATMETNSDITERQRAETALHQAQAELAHVTRITTMGELTASIAHEINQPLAAVVANGDACLRWLGREVPDLDEARAAVSQMIRNGRRASDVVAKLRALARRGETQHVAVDVGELVDDVVLLLERELASHRVALEFAHRAPVPPVLGDRVQLQQVVLNLVLNALQAMDAVPEASRRLQIRTARIGADGAAAAVIEVVDSGPGVSPESLPLLFNAFYSTKTDGMGMGLSISRSIIDAHGGRIDAALNDGGGMRFTITLPLVAEAVS